MGSHNVGYTRQELSDLTGVHPRTITTWTTMGILPPPHGKGNGVHRYYSSLHVTRIEDVKTLRDNNRTLADLADYFNPLEDDEDDE